MHHGPRRMRLHLTKIINPGDNSQRRQWPWPTYITWHARTVHEAQALAACRVIFVGHGRCLLWLASPGLSMVRWNLLRLGPSCMRLLCRYGSGVTAGSANGRRLGVLMQSRVPSHVGAAASCTAAEGSSGRLVVQASGITGQKYGPPSPTANSLSIRIAL